MEPRHKVRQLVEGHQRAAAFLALAVAMVLVVLVASRDVAMQPGQRAMVVASTVAVAGLSVWIVTWE